MSHNAKTSKAAAGGAVGVLVAAGAALAVTQLADDPDTDPAPPTTRVIGPPPQGLGHAVDPDTGQPFRPDVDTPMRNHSSRAGPVGPRGGGLTRRR